MERDKDSAGSIESFFSGLQSTEASPRNLNQIFEDDLLPMQRESRNLRYQPGGGHRTQKPQPKASPAEVSSEDNGQNAVIEKKPRPWSVAFAKIVNIYNGYHPVERMGLALTMLGENEAATMILYKQKTQTISNTKLKPNGKTIHLQDHYVQFYDDSRKYWSLRFVYPTDEEEFIHTMTSHEWPLEQHSPRFEDDVELDQQQQNYPRSEEEVEQEQQLEHSPRSEEEVEQLEHSPRSEDDLEQPQQDTEQPEDQTGKLLSQMNSEEFKEHIRQKQEQITKQLRDQFMAKLKQEEIERNERYRQMHIEQNREQQREQLRDQTRERLREQNREHRNVRNSEQRAEQIREQVREHNRENRGEQNQEPLWENLAEHQEPRRHTCVHHRHSRNNEAPPQPMPRSRNQATAEEDHSARRASYRECLRRHFMHLGCEHMRPDRERQPEEYLSCESTQPVQDETPEEDLIVTPMSRPIGSTSSNASMQNHCSSASAVVQMPGRSADITISSQLANFINTHMAPGQIAELRIQNILDAMQRVSDGHRRNFTGNQNDDAPQPQPRQSMTEEAEEAEDRVLQLEQILLNARKENRRLSREIKLRDDDLLSFQRSSLALMEKLMVTNEDLTERNSRLVDKIMRKSKASKKENCGNCVRSAEEILILKTHIHALKLALRESD